MVTLVIIRTNLHLTILYLIYKQKISTLYRKIANFLYYIHFT